MTIVNENEFKLLFSELCCSQCRNDFTTESLEIMEQQNGILICRLSCKKCGADFGDIVLKYNQNTKMHTPLEVIEGPQPISTDDVLNAHEFIKKNL